MARWRKPEGEAWFRPTHIVWFSGSHDCRIRCVLWVKDYRSRSPLKWPATSHDR